MKSKTLLSLLQAMEESGVEISKIQLIIKESEKDNKESEDIKKETTDDQDTENS